MHKLEIKASFQVSDAGEITGNAWPFGAADRVGDVIEKNAFADAPATLPILWAHDQGQTIGVWNSIKSTGAGLEVKGKLLTHSVEKAKEVRALVQAGAVTGLSIGFVTRKLRRKKRRAQHLQTRSSGNLHRRGSLSSRRAHHVNQRKQHHV